MTTTVFAIVDAVVLRALPYDEPEQIMRLESRVPGLGHGEPWNLSVAGYLFFRRESTSFEALGAFTGREKNMSGVWGAERAYVAQVTASLIPVLRGTPALGRLISVTDDLLGSTAVAVLAHEFWVRRYGSDSTVLGQTILIEGRPYEIVGVFEAGFHLPEQRVDVWTPWILDPQAPAVNAHYVPVLGRLRTGLESSDAQEELSRLTGRLPDVFPRAYSAAWMAESRFSTHVIPLRVYVLGGSERSLWILFAVVGVVLVIGCANVANLFFVRAESRKTEIAIRQALGATRRHVARLFLLESFVLTLLGAGLALWLSRLGLGVLHVVGPTVWPRFSGAAIDGVTVGFTLITSIVVALAVASYPFLRFRRGFSRTNLTEVLRSKTGGSKPHAVLDVLAVAQVALALVIVVFAGLMLRSFMQLRNVDPGFETDGVLTFRYSLPLLGYRGAENVARFHAQFLARLEAVPTVVSAGMIHRLPLKENAGCFGVYVEDRPVVPGGQQAPCLSVRFTAPGFFQTMGISLVQGRDFTWSDLEHRTGVALVSQALAERLWGEDPIGRGIGLFRDRPPFYRVIGVVDDIHETALDRLPRDAVYLPLLAIRGQPSWGADAIRSMTVVVASEAVPLLGIVSMVRQLVAELDSSLPITGVETMEQVVRRSIAPVSLMLVLLGIAAGLSLVLAAIGLYAVIASMVVQRGREIAIRLALGAQKTEVAALILRRTFMLSSVGVLIGLGFAIGATRVLGSLLFEAGPNDPVLLASVGALLLAVTLLASLVPTLRAMRVNPMSVLRTE